MTEFSLSFLEWRINHHDIIIYTKRRGHPNGIVESSGCPIVFDKTSLFLSGADGAHGASVRASTAIHADIGIDMVNVAFAYSSGRAFSKACSACNAVSLRNFVSHSLGFKKFVSANVGIFGKMAKYLINFVEV